MKRYTCCLILAAALFAPACGDDDPASPRGFAVTLNVRDTDGDPVEGLSLVMMPDGPWYQDGWPAKRGLTSKRSPQAATNITWTQPVPANILLTVEDVEGAHVQTLDEGWHVAGEWRTDWQGRNDTGERLPTGRYTVRMVVRDGQGTLLAEKTRDMLMATLAVPVADTDAQGRMVLQDKRMFPHLYQRSAMQAVDEYGNLMGEMIFTDCVRVRLDDAGQGLSDHYYVEVSADGGVFDLVWDPSPTPRVTTREAPVSVQRSVPDTPTDFELHRPHPNPFN